MISGALLLSLGVAVTTFFGVYLTYEYWAQRVWSRLSSTLLLTEQAYKDIFQKKTERQILQLHLAISGSLAVLVLLATWPQILFGLPVGVIVFFMSWKLPYLYLSRVVKPSRVSKFSSQMVDSLTLMANGMKSGLEIQQALQIVVNEMPNPIREEFNAVLSDIRLGKAPDEAFEELGRRIDSEDVRIFVTSVVILKETGGNINETFQNIAKTIRERLKLQSKIQAMTSQGMASAVIVGGLPWVLAGILYAADPVQMTPLFTTIPGFVILLVVMALELMGFFVILKIVRIKV
jgi:tight adherence protein B